MYIVLFLLQIFQSDPKSGGCDTMLVVACIAERITEWTKWMGEASQGMYFLTQWMDAPPEIHLLSTFLSSCSYDSVT